MAPILTNPTGVATGETTSTGAVDTDTNGGFMYIVVTQSAAAPTAAQVKLGQDHLGAAADFATNFAQTLFPPVTLTVLATGLIAATTYFFHFMHEESSGGQSSVVSSSAFATDATPVLSRRCRGRSRNAVVRGML